MSARVAFMSRETCRAMWLERFGRDPDFNEVLTVTGIEILFDDHMLLDEVKVLPHPRPDDD